MGTVFPAMLVAKDVDSERAVEASERIKGKNKRGMNEMKEEIKGSRLKH